MLETYLKLGLQIQHCTGGWGWGVGAGWRGLGLNPSEVKTKNCGTILHGEPLLTAPWFRLGIHCQSLEMPEKRDGP